MTASTLILAGIGVWFVAEGAAYALAPDSMKRLLHWAARLPVAELRQGGLWTVALGAILLYAALRFL